MITCGQSKGKVGFIVGQERRSWTLELEDGRRVTTSFPMVALVEASAEAEQASGEQVQEITEV